MSEILLKTEGLTIDVKNGSDYKTIINNISYHINTNEIVGVVGESGSGKSVSSLAILGLLSKAIFKITSGSIIFENKDLTTLSNKNNTHFSFGL